MSMPGKGTDEKLANDYKTLKQLAHTLCSYDFKTRRYDIETCERCVARGRKEEDEHPGCAYGRRAIELAEANEEKAKGVSHMERIMTLRIRIRELEDELADMKRENMSLKKERRYV